MNLRGKLVIICQICQILTYGSCKFTERNTDDRTGDDGANTNHFQRAGSKTPSDFALSSNNAHLILENIKHTLLSSDSSHRRLLNYGVRKERVNSNCEPINDVNKRIGVLDDGQIKHLRCKNAPRNIEGLSATLNSTKSSNDRLNNFENDFVEAAGNALRFSERNLTNDRTTIKSYQQIPRKDVSSQSSGITRFITNSFISQSRDVVDNLTDVIEYIRKKRDDSEVKTVIVAGPLNADNIADVFDYLHKYLKILTHIVNVTVVTNDSNMVLNEGELCTKTWNEYFGNTEGTNIVHVSRTAIHDMKDSLIVRKLNMLERPREDALEKRLKNAIEEKRCIDDEKRDDEQSYCISEWDNYSCWPRTPANSTATIRCPSYLLHIDKSQNATKHCFENGTWADKAVYDLCIPNPNETAVDSGTTGSEAVRIIYNVGFSVSTLTLAIALFIFLYFRSLRCLRNSIHCHLIVTFIIKNIIWIIMWHSLVYIKTSSCTWCCKALTTIFNFAHASNFFWMFVEGLYLHIIIVWTYSADKIKLKYLLLIGWGLPSVNITAWLIVKLLHETEQDKCWFPQEDDEGNSSVYDYIYIGPILFVLFANIIFLSTIVWVLITKLRASHSLETRQYRKAVKATIILFPLLGIIYVIFICPPSDHPQVHLIFTYINAILQSFQGLLVAVFYCFLNGEVKSVLKKKLARLNDARSLSTKYTRTSYNWTRNSRDFGNTTTIANGSLTEMTRTSGEAKDTPECIPLTDNLQVDKQT